MDESGISQKPPIRGTWAPRGRTPVLEHAFNWKKLSAATFLGYRADNRAHELFFRVKPGNYAGADLIELLEAFKKQMGRRGCVLIWDGLPAHQSALMQEYLGRQKSWLEVERLPGYAPELNPVEQVWASVKGGELANLCAKSLGQTGAALRKGLRRVGRSKSLPKSFLEHAGLSL